MIAHLTESYHNEAQYRNPNQYVNLVTKAQKIFEDSQLARLLCAYLLAPLKGDTTVEAVYR